MIKFFNTLTGKLEEFKPLREGEVGLYTCGPTVYDFAHIGNFRTFVFEDLLRRFLLFKGYRVTHVMNITDVDDKTIAGAVCEGKGLKGYTEFYTRAFHDDLEALNILPPTKGPKATEEIPAMIGLIDRLVKKGTAYVSGGSVYYRISNFPGYGKLSKKRLDQNIAGAGQRVDADEYDREKISDFVLWKKAKEGDPSWDSPWGKGRPGWHIECSAMSMKYLGETFDIHAGGEDLIFPHHENEIAQSEGATGKPFARYWLHSKHLLVNGEKMSKSKGNFYTLRGLRAMKDDEGRPKYDPMTIRYALFSVHYRQQFSFSLEGLRDAKESLKRIRDFWYECSGVATTENRHGMGKISALVKKARQEFTQAMEDDLNISRALGVLFDFIKEGNAVPKNDRGTKENKEADIFFNEIDNVLGILSAFVTEISPHAKRLVGMRDEARKSKNFALADELRNQVRKEGLILEDTRDGTRVKKLL